MDIDSFFDESEAGENHEEGEVDEKYHNDTSLNVLGFGGSH